MTHWSLSHTANCMSPCGFCGSLSIDSKVHKKGPHYSVHICKTRSRWGDPWNGTLVVAKFLDRGDREVTEEWANCQVRKSRIAQETAIKFNNCVRHINKIRPRSDTPPLEAGRGDLAFLPTQTCRLEKVSVLHGQRKKKEAFIVMDLIEPKRFQTFINCTGAACDKTCKGDKRSSVPTSRRELHPFRSMEEMPVTRFAGLRQRLLTKTRSKSQSYGSDACLTSCNNCDKWNSQGLLHATPPPHPYLQAFVHYFYFATGGKIAIDGLKGGYDPSGRYLLSVPTLHSLDRGFGDEDQGQKGMAAVIDSHVCSDLCCPLPPMTLTMATEGHAHSVCHTHLQSDNDPICQATQGNCVTHTATETGAPSRQQAPGNKTNHLWQTQTVQLWPRPLNRHSPTAQRQLC